MVAEAAADALLAVAELAVVPPEHVSRTHEPVFVRHVQLDRIPVAQNFGPPDEGDVVEVHDVEVAALDDLADLFPVDYGLAELVRHQTREPADRLARTPETVCCHTGRLFKFCRFFARVQDVEGIDVVDHLDFVTAPGESMRKPLYEDRIATKVMRWVERCNHCEAQPAHRCALRVGIIRSGLV